MNEETIKLTEEEQFEEYLTEQEEEARKEDLREQIYIYEHN